MDDDNLDNDPIDNSLDGCVVIVVLSVAIVVLINYISK